MYLSLFICLSTFLPPPHQFSYTSVLIEFCYTLLSMYLSIYVLSLSLSLCIFLFMHQAFSLLCICLPCCLSLLNIPIDLSLYLSIYLFLASVFPLIVFLSSLLNILLWKLTHTIHTVSCISIINQKMSRIQPLSLTLVFFLEIIFDCAFLE